MEEVIRINWFGSQKIITKQALSMLQPLLTQQNIRLLSFPSWMNSFKLELNVFHSCFYYVLAVDKDIHHSKLINFRQKCLANITQYYVRHKMTFQLYQYAYLCAKILTISIERTMHIIYFLVYARMASKPFIYNQIKSIERNGRQGLRKNTNKSRYTYSVRSKQTKSRHFTIFADSSQCEVESLKKELKNILKPQISLSKKIVRKGDSKKLVNLKKVLPYQSAQNTKEQSKFANTVTCRSSISKMESMIPIKVNNYQNSSIIRRLGMKQKSINTISSKKILFRKLNLNQFCEYQFIEEKQPINFQLTKMSALRDRNNAKINKNPLSYFQNLASEIKNKNDHLDTVRYQCSYANRNTVSQCFQHAQKEEQRVRFKNIRKTEIVTYDSQKNIDYQKIFRRSQNVQEKYGTVKYNNKQGENYVSITRKNQNICLYDGQDPNKKFSKKNRVQKYKQQYSNFLKTSLFKIPRDTA